MLDTCVTNCEIGHVTCKKFPTNSGVTNVLVTPFRHYLTCYIDEIHARYL